MPGTCFISAAQKSEKRCLCEREKKGDGQERWGREGVGIRDIKIDSVIDKSLEETNTPEQSKTRPVTGTCDSSVC